MCVLLSCSQEEEEEASSRYYVPSYEEVMNTNYAEARDVDQNPRMSISLPSYESLTGLDETSPTTHTFSETPVVTIGQGFQAQARKALSSLQTPSHPHLGPGPHLHLV